MENSQEIGEGPKKYLELLSKYKNQFERSIVAKILANTLMEYFESNLNASSEGAIDLLDQIAMAKGGINDETFQAVYRHELEEAKKQQPGLNITLLKDTIRNSLGNWCENLKKYLEDSLLD